MVLPYSPAGHNRIQAASIWWIFFSARKKIAQTTQYRSTKKVHFSLFPAAVNVPGGGRAVITAVNAAFYLGNPVVTNLSNVYVIPYTNLADRYGLYLRPNIWLPRNKFNLIGDYRIAHFPQYTWGLGGNSPEWDRSLIDSDYIRFYQTVLKKIFPHWYAGPGYAWDYHYNISESEFTGEGHLDRYGDGLSGSTKSSGFTGNLVYDSRKNAINPRGGSYLLFSWRWNDTKLGSSFTNNSLFIDGRKYISINSSRWNILALRSYYWTIINGSTPYLDLPSTNWAPASGVASRGFQFGRYRSNAMLYAEAEHRYQLSSNGLWGLVIFANLASASEYGTQQFVYWHPGAGVGVRAKLNKYSDSNLSIDIAFSKNYWGVWLNIGEVF
ncbi:BamA/TamA family outer membrane protein [Oscillatoria amoena NRMC-F 0135]|nr:BamA/TamA family outer membrane protein [Oscillatoria amoena NRMC-F 0135]